MKNTKGTAKNKYWRYLARPVFEISDYRMTVKKRRFDMKIIVQENQ